MIRPLLVCLVAGLALASAARADDDPWPRDPDARITAQVAACEADQPAACFEVADAMQHAGIASRFGHTPEQLRERGEAALDAQCTAGHADACWEHGRALVKRGDKARGTIQIQRGCDLGNGDACLALAEQTPSPAQALALFGQACDHGRGIACELAVARIGTRDPARVLALHRQGCAGGDATGCLRVGEHDRASGDLARAFDDFERACEAERDAHAQGDGIGGCDAAGALATDAAKARELFQAACDAGYGVGCEHLGERIARGEGGDRDWGAGLAQVADGCKRAHDRACHLLAALKQHPPDWQCATADECRRFCDEQLWPACRRLVELAGLDASEPTNHWLELACTGDDALGCRLRGDNSAAFADALPWYRRGCRLHEPAACAYLDFSRALRSAAAAAALRAACAKDPAACPLYGLAIAKRDRPGATTAWRRACEAKVGVACRFLARTFEATSRGGDDAMISLVLGGTKPGYGTCDCDDGHALTQAQADDGNRRFAESQRLLHLGCEAGDARSCDDTLGPDRVEAPPSAVVALPAWE